MAWQTEMTILLRNVVGDIISPYEYTDSRLEEILVVAAYFVVDEVDFTTDYTVNISTTSITPDPIDGSDTSFVNLVVLKAACLLKDSEYRTASNKALSVRDGPSSIDGRAVADAKYKLATEACQRYENAELEYRMGNSKAGEAIVGPYRYYGGNDVSYRSRPSY